MAERGPRRPADVTEVVARGAADEVTAVSARRPLERLGRYALLEKLAEGGMGAVHAALRDGDRSVCVLKQLRPDVAHDAVAVKRFYREASIGAQLLHPRIAKVLGAGTEDGVFCIAMELVRGLDLDAMHAAMTSAGRLLPPALVVRAGLGVLDALAYAHQARGVDGAPLGVVHRDLTLRNVMLGFDGEAKVIDFGLVRGAGDSLRTQPGMFMGTPRFASPEQATGVPVDARSDLYSVGACLFELLTGRALVSGDDLMAILAAVRSERAPMADEVNPAVPRALALVLARALEKDRERRFASAERFASALAEACPTEAAVGATEVAAFMHEHFEERALKLRALFERGEALARRAPPSPARAFADPDTRSEAEPDPSSTPEPTFVVFRDAEPPEPTALLVPERRGREESVLLTPTLIPTAGGRTVRSAATLDRRVPWGLVALVALGAAGAGSALTASLLLRGPAGAPTATPLARPPAPVAVVATATLAPASVTPPSSPAPTESARARAVGGPPALRSRAPAPPTPTPERPPSHPGPLHALLDAYAARPSEEARRALTDAIARHPERAKVELELVKLTHALGEEAALRQLRAAVSKLEP